MALIDRQLSDCCSGFAQFWAAVLRVPALRESPRTPREASLRQKPAGQPGPPETSSSREHQIAGGTDHTQQGKVSYVAASPRSNSISNQESVACRVARAAELSLLSTPIGGREREPRRHRKTSFRRVAGRPCCAARAAKNSFFSQVATWPRWTTPTRCP